MKIIYNKRITEDKSDIFFKGSSYFTRAFIIDKMCLSYYFYPVNTVTVTEHDNI